MEALERLWTCEPQCELREMCQPYSDRAAQTQQLDDQGKESRLARLQESREDPLIYHGKKSRQKPRCARTGPCSKDRSAVDLGSLCAHGLARLCTHFSMCSRRPFQGSSVADAEALREAEILRLQRLGWMELRTQGHGQPCFINMETRAVSWTRPEVRAA